MSSTVFVGNIPYCVPAEEITLKNILKELFEKPGPVVNLTLAKDQKGRLKGFGFIEYADHETALRAVQDCNGVTFGTFGRKLKVKIVEPKLKTAKGLEEENAGISNDLKPAFQETPATENRQDLSVPEDVAELPPGDIKTKPVVDRKTKAILCKFFAQGRCSLPDCSFAHSEEEQLSFQADKVSKHKFTLCKFFAQGRCAVRDCTFAHGEEELQSGRGYREKKHVTAENRKTKICQYWLKGECHFGDGCMYAHGEDDMQGRVLLIEPSATQGDGSASQDANQLAPQETKVMRVRMDAVPSIIGVKRTAIQKIANDCRVRLTLMVNAAEDSEPDARKISITGNAAQINLAQEMVKNSVQQFMAKHALDQAPSASDGKIRKLG